MAEVLAESGNPNEILQRGPKSFLRNLFSEEQRSFGMLKCFLSRSLFRCGTLFDPFELLVTEWVHSLSTPTDVRADDALLRLERPVLK